MANLIRVCSVLFRLLHLCLVLALQSPASLTADVLLAIVHILPWLTAPRVHPTVLLLLPKREFLPGYWRCDY